MQIEKTHLHFRKPQKKGLLISLDKQFYAEASPLPYFSYENFEEITSISEKEIKLLLSKAGENLPSYLPPSVAFAILSLHLQLKHTFHYQFTFTALLKGTHEQIIEQAYLNIRCPTWKVKIGSFSSGKAAFVMSQLRKTFPEKRLRVDCNQSWSYEEATEFISHFNPCDFEYIEEPTKELNDLEKLANIHHMPIAVDETIREYGLNTVLQEIPSLQFVIIKPTLSGDIRPMIKKAKESHKKVVLSSSYESPVGLYCIANLSKIFSCSCEPGIGTFPYTIIDALPIDIRSDHETILFKSNHLPHLSRQY
jgi:o-succinylbenzoate synthase